MNKLIKVSWQLFIYIFIGMVILFFRVAITPWGFLFLTPDYAMKHIFFYPVIIIRDLLGL